MVEVQLRPGAPGCLRYPVSVLTLGLYPLMARLAERKFIRRMDEQGVETRGGQRIAWNEFTRIRRVRSGYGTPGSRPTATWSDEFILGSPRGKVSLPTWRTVNAKEAVDYALARLPRTIAGREWAAFPSRNPSRKTKCEDENA
jgi:hypothetical protein